MKKLISIGVALAVLAMVVLPLGAAAQCDYDGVAPTTYAKIPFAIIQTGLMLVGDLIVALEPADLGIPTWLADVTDAIAPWAGGPLSWTVDMLGWGLGLVGAILTPELAGILGLPDWIPDVVSTITCHLFAPFNCPVTGGNWTPCPTP